MVLIGDSNGFIKLWQLSDGKLLRTIRVFQGGVAYFVKFLPDSQTIAVEGSESNTSLIKLVRASDGQTIRTMTITHVPSSFMEITPDGNILVDGSFLEIYRPSDGALLKTISGAFYFDVNNIRRDFNGGVSGAFQTNSGNIATSLVVNSNYYPAVIDPTNCYTDNQNITRCQLIGYFPSLYLGTRGITRDGTQILAYTNNNQVKVYSMSDACTTPGAQTPRCYNSVVYAPTPVATLSGDRFAVFSPDGQKMAISTFSGGNGSSIKSL